MIDINKTKQPLYLFSATVTGGKITCDTCGTSVPADSWKQMDAHMEIHASSSSVRPRK